MPTPQTTEARLHPIVTLDYRVRVIAMLVMGLILLFHFEGRPPLLALLAMAIPVVMVSISDDEDRGLAMGAADYLVRPVDRERLAGILADYRTGAVGTANPA